MVHIGVSSNVRFLDMGTSKWSDGVLESFPALHVISGCDSVSAFKGKGKEKWLSTVQKKEKYLQSVFAMYFKNWKIVSSDETNVNDTSYRKFHMENMPEPQLPATKDELPNILYVRIIRPRYGREA